MKQGNIKCEILAIYAKRKFSVQPLEANRHVEEGAGVKKGARLAFRVSRLAFQAPGIFFLKSSNRFH